MPWDITDKALALSQMDLLEALQTGTDYVTVRVTGRITDRALTVSQNGVTRYLSDGTLTLSHEWSDWGSTDLTTSHLRQINSYAGSKM